jgi:hypothetical protein
MRFLRFALESARHRWVAFLLVATAHLALAAGVLAVLPRTYEIGCRIVVPPDSSSDSGFAANARDSPARTARPLILSRENLLHLIRQADLVMQPSRNRAPLTRFSEWVRARTGGSRDDRVDGLVLALQERLVVTTEEDTVVAIRLRWPDPLEAERLVDAAQRNFLDKRFLLEVTSISQAIAVLERRAAALRARIDAGAAAARSTAARPPAPAGGGRGDAPVASQEDQKLRNSIDATHRAIVDLEDLARRSMLRLELELAEQRLVLAPNHPALAVTARRLDALRTDSPELQSLRQRESSLRVELSKRSAQTLPAPPPPRVSEQGERRERRSGARNLESAQGRVDSILYQALKERIAAERLRSEAATETFNRRYTVVWPPDVPTRPLRPDRALVLIASALDALLLGLFATTAAELRRSRLGGAPAASSRHTAEPRIWVEQQGR